MQEMGNHEFEKDDLFEDPNIPIEFALMSARKYPEMKKSIFRQLFNRTKDEASVEVLKSDPYYYEMLNEILNGDNTEEKIHLILYFEPDLVEEGFGSMENLVNAIVNKPAMYDKHLDSVNDLMQLADYNYDHNITELIVKGIEKILDRYDKEMLELAKEFRPDFYESVVDSPEYDERKELLKMKIIEEVRNKNKRHLS